MKGDVLLFRGLSRAAAGAERGFQAEELRRAALPGSAAERRAALDARPQGGDLRSVCGSWTSLERSGALPKMAQTFARRSDIRPTLGTYTHVGLHDQTAAIEALLGLNRIEKKRPGRRFDG